MQSSENQRTQIIINDVLFHLENLKCATRRLQLDYNREEGVYHFCEKSLNRLELVEQLTQHSKLQLPILIANGVNDLFMQDKNLSIAHLQIINSKRTFNPTAIAHLKITT